jgi:hypothetical protein
MSLLYGPDGERITAEHFPVGKAPQPQSDFDAAYNSLSERLGRMLWGTMAPGHLPLYDADGNLISTSASEAPRVESGIEKLFKTPRSP